MPAASQAEPGRIVDRFLGSVHILARALDGLLEDHLREVTGGTLTPSQIRLVSVVALTKAPTVSDVATFLGVSHAAASKAVDRLVRRGLLRRAEARRDRRAVELSLTEAGQRLLERYEAVTHNVLHETVGALSGQALHETTQLLDHLALDIVDRGNDSPGAVCVLCGVHFREQCLLRRSRGRTCFFHQRRKSAATGGSGDWYEHA